MSLSSAARPKILLGALILGVLAGAVAHPFKEVAEVAWMQTHLLAPVGQIFLRMIFMVVVPLVFSALVLGVFELGQTHGLGKVAGKTLMYTVIASALSVVVGVTAVNLIQPGKGFTLPTDPSTTSALSTSVAKVAKNAAEAKPFSQSIVELVPKNPLDAAVNALNGEMLALMVFALIFGVAIARIKRAGKDTDTLLSFLEQVFAASMEIIGFAMKLAPLAIFAIVFGTIFQQGLGILKSLGLYVGVVVGGLLFQQLVVYSALLKLIAKRSPLAFFRACREVYLQAFSTASSNATLPLTLETAEHTLHLSPRISRFVLTVGSTANQNGTALFEGITVLFLAQVYNIDLSLAQQAQVVLMSILAGIGTAGVPGGSLPLIMILLQSVGVPPEGIGLILGADRFLDMCRTTLNVSGDLVIAALVDDGSGARTE